MIPAPEQVRLAFNRVLVAARAHPLSFILPADAETIARKVLADGLTTDQARAVQKNLDTAQERTVAKNLLLQIASAADATTLLTWLADDVKRALTVKPVEPIEPEATEGTEVEAVLNSVKWQGFPKVKLSYSGTSKWPKKGEDDDVVQAILKVNGKKVDWLHPGQTVQSLENIFGKKYGQDVRSGQTVQISIADINGKNDTNSKTLVWP